MSIDRCGSALSRRGFRVLLAISAIALSGGLAFAQASSAEAANAGDASPPPLDAGGRGWNAAFPAYFYGGASVSGAQLGFQAKGLQVRMDALLASGVKDGGISLFAAPSLGVFFSQDWTASLRVYQGLSAGAEVGIVNSFEGLNFFVDFLAGIEWRASKGKAFFLEIGSGIGYPTIAGAFNGGTVIGGGVKSYF